MFISGVRKLNTFMENVINYIITIKNMYLINIAQKNQRFYQTDHNEN